MLTLISCAKTMVPASKVQAPLLTEPRFAGQATDIAMHMAQYSVDELQQMLQVNDKIAVENYHRYQAFASPDNRPLQALLAYTGIVFKRIQPKDFSHDDFLYAQDHLRLTSFCYGLLRPLDGIRNYRLEGCIHLPGLGDDSLFSYWRSQLTDTLIEDIKQQGGVLVNAASDEMKQLFDWQRVKQETKVITPVFQVEKAGKLKTIVVYTKMARGELTRFMLKNRTEHPDEMKEFSFDGFSYRADLSDDHTYYYIMTE